MLVSTCICINGRKYLHPFAEELILSLTEKRRNAEEIQSLIKSNIFCFSIDVPTFIEMLVVVFFFQKSIQNKQISNLYKTNRY